MLATLLGRESRSLLDNPNVSLSDPASFDYLTNNVATDAGINVSPKSILRLPAVWQAVTMISSDIAKLPLDVYLSEDGDNRTVDLKHPAHYLVSEQASDNITALELWQTCMVHALIWNNGYIFIDRANNGTPLGLYNLLPDRTHPEIVGGKLIYVTETSRPNGVPWIRPLDPKDVIHIKGISLDGMQGLDTVESAKHSWAIAISQQKFQAKFFKNGVRAGGILELPASMTPKVRDKVEEGFKKQSGEDQWFRTVILRDNAKFHQQTFDPQSAQLVEMDEAGVRNTARWFNMSPSRLGLSDSVSYNSKSEDNQSYLDTTLDIWLKKIVRACNLRLLSDDDRRTRRRFFEHNTSALLRMNLKDRYTAYGVGYGRWLSRNDIRKAENMPSTGPSGDEFAPVQTINGAVAQGGDGTGDTGGANKKGNDKPRGAGKRSDRTKPTQETIEIRRLVFNLADHARKKSSNPRAFIEFVDSNLDFHRKRSSSIDGAEDWINRAHSTLKTLAESKSAGELESAVDASMTEFESSCP